MAESLPYRCELSVKIEDDRRSRYASRWVELPFVPAAGMYLHGFKEIDGFNEGERVERVTWRREGGSFLVDLEDDPSPDEGESFEEHVRGFWGEGWTLEE